MFAGNVADAIDERQGPRCVRSAAAISLTVQTNQTSRSRHTRARSLSRYASVRCAAGKIDGELTGIDPVDNRCASKTARQSAVVAEFGFIDETRRKDGLEREHAILRKCSDFQYSTANALRLSVIALIAEEASVKGVLIV